MPNCSVFSCKKRSATSSIQKDNVSFHLFPKGAILRDVWIKACGNHVSWTPKRTSTICSQHFESSCFITQSNNKRRLKQSAVPTLELPKVEFNDECKPGTSTPSTSTISSQQYESSCFKTQSNNLGRLKKSAMLPLELVKVEFHEPSTPIKLEIIEDSPPSEIQECKSINTPIKVKTFEDSLSANIQECKSTKDQSHMPQSENYNLQLYYSPREIKLKQLLQRKNKQIKRLQSQIRYLNEKVAGLQQILTDLSENR